MTRTPVRVLLVEDDQVDRLACRRALANHPDYSFELIEAETGHEGIRLALARQPDLILLDYHLPDLSGLEFLAELQREGGEMPVPVMMLTGADNVGVAVEAMRRGARDYLVKDRDRNYLELLPAVIERVLREQRLRGEKRAAEVKFRTLVEQIPAITYMAALDVPGRLLYISPQVQSLGFSPEEWLTDPDGLLKAVHPDDRAAVRGAYAGSYASGEPLRCEYRVETRAGETRWLLNEARIVCDADDAPLFLQGVMIDITEEKRREEELEYQVAQRTAQLDKRNALLEAANTNLSRQIEERERAELSLRASEERYRALIEQASEGIFIADSEGRYTEVNDAGLHMLGYTRDEIISKTIFDLIPPEDVERLGQSKEQLLRGDVHVAEWRLRRKDGTYLPVEVSAKILPDGRWQGLVHDITERQQAEQALRASEARFRLLLESAGEGIYGLDTAGRCIFVNDAALEMTGFVRDELLGQPTHPHIHHSLADGTPYPADKCPIYEAFRTGVAQRGMIVPLWRKDGSMLIAEYSSYPLREGDNVSGAVLVFRDVTESQALADQLAWQATHDALTGLVNRQEFEHRLAHVLDSAHREGAAHALCYLDLDQFKVVNDTCGHAAGDELLRQISTLLQGRMRQRDTLARLGGDEFGILLEHCPTDRAMGLALELRDAVRDFRFSWQGRSFTLGVSIGVAPLTGSIDTAAAAMRAADAACYVAKEQGRNRAHLYHADDVSLVEHRSQMLWVLRLTQALDEDRFRLYYQTIVPLNANPSTRPHYEVLLRLLEPDGRLVEPMAFVPAAERYNLMPAIDRWVLREVIGNSAAAQRRAEPRPLFAVNLSSRSLTDEHLPDYLRELLASHGVPGDMLCLEITEAAAAANLNQANLMIAEFKQLGCRIALDHFGCGMSSFTDLKAFPVDFIKIDGGLIRSLAVDRVNRAVADAINRIAHVMMIQTVAECTETDAVVTILKELGIDHAQGYVLALPQPIERLSETAPLA
jgi:diguanylate cyclase (GGDEF)-like protein/PAS domain S-box-containing protein